MPSIQILSDLHLEFHKDEGREFVRKLKVEADMLILAGDVIPLTSFDVAKHTLGMFCERWQDVFYVPGNHEYYHSNPKAVSQILTGLNEEFGNLMAVRQGRLKKHQYPWVIGTTLWFPETPEALRYRRSMSDFRVIADFEPWVYEESARGLEFLKEALTPGCIVVTHHLPHPDCVDAKYKGNPLNPFFLNTLAVPLVESGQASLWVYGHTHTPMDFRIGPTRLICNPVGYPHEGTVYNPSLIVHC